MAGLLCSNYKYWERWYVDHYLYSCICSLAYEERACQEPSAWPFLWNGRPWLIHISAQSYFLWPASWWNHLRVFIPYLLPPCLTFVFSQPYLTLYFNILQRNSFSLLPRNMSSVRRGTWFLFLHYIITALNSVWHIVVAQLILVE